MRYELQLKLGASEALALATVASSYGLATNVIRLTSDGKERTVDIPWTLRDMDRLLFAQWAFRNGRLNDW